MSLTFNPALGVKRTIPVPRDGKVKLRFAATFPSRYAYESARENGTRIEMWTNLASPIGDWHALPFEFALDKARSGQATEGAVLSLVPSAPESKDKEETSVYLDLELSDCKPDTRFAFTYRLVRPWGEVQWLGSYGKNGELTFVGDTRFALEEGWKFGEGESVFSTKGEVEEGLVAKLSKEVEWSSWAFEKDGWPVFSSSAVAPLSSAILLVPTVPKDSRVLVVPQPLVVATEKGAVAVSPTGHIVAQGVSTLTIRTVQSCAGLQDVLPDNLRLANLNVGEGFAGIVSKPTAEADSAMTLSVVPVQSGKAAPVTDVLLDDSVLPITSTSDAVLVNVSSISGNPDILLLEAEEKKDVTIRFGAVGGQVLYTPLHTLALPEDESAWKLALLNPHSSAFVEFLQEEDTSLTLPTPPPSPPPTRLSPISPAARMSPSLSISVAESLEEITSKDAAETEEPASSPSTVEPLTPSSPVLGDSTGFKTGTVEVAEPGEEFERVHTEEQMKVEGNETHVEVVSEDEHNEEVPQDVEVETKEEASADQVSEKPESLTVIPKQPVRGFMRLVIFWIFRALFERVCSIFTTSARWWGLPKLFTGLSQRLAGGKNEEKLIEEKKEPEDMDREIPSVAVEETVEEQVEGKIEEKTEEVIPAIVEPEPNPVDDGLSVIEEVTLIQQEDEPIATSEPVEEDRPLAISVPSPKPIFETETPTTVIIHKRAPLKPRFLADVRSNLVSLLVRAPHSLAKPDNLNITIDGKHVSDSYPGYRCTQLLGDFYLVGLRGPSEGAKLEVTVD